MDVRQSKVAHLLQRSRSTTAQEPCERPAGASPLESPSTVDLGSAGVSHTIDTQTGFGERDRWVVAQNCNCPLDRLGGSLRPSAPPAYRSAGGSHVVARFRARAMGSLSTSADAGKPSTSSQAMIHIGRPRIARAVCAGDRNSPARYAGCGVRAGAASRDRGGEATHPVGADEAKGVRVRRRRGPSGHTP